MKIPHRKQRGPSLAPVRKHGSHQWLELLKTWPDLPAEEYVFDIYLPIRE